MRSQLTYKSCKEMKNLNTIYNGKPKKKILEEYIGDHSHNLSSEGVRTQMIQTTKKKLSFCFFLEHTSQMGLIVIFKVNVFK